MTEYLAIQIPMGLLREIDKDLIDEGWLQHSFTLWPQPLGNNVFFCPTLILKRTVK